MDNGEHWRDGLSVLVDGVEYVRHDEYDNLRGHRDRLREERDTARDQLRGAVGALRQIAEDRPLDPTAQEIAERALDAMGVDPTTSRGQ